MKTFQQFLQFLEEKKGISKKRKEELTKGIVVNPNVKRDSDGTLRYNLRDMPKPPQTQPNSDARKIQTNAIEKASGAKAFKIK